MAHVRSRTTKDGSPRYAVVWRDPDGKSREKWYRNRRAADREAARLTTTLASNTYTDDRTGKTTLKTVADEWLNSLTRATPRTRREYQRLLTTRVLPHFGPARPVASISQPDVTAYLRALTEEGLRPQTISNAYAPLRACLRYAARRRCIPTPPTDGIDLPDAKTLCAEEFEGIYLTRPQLDAIATAATTATGQPSYGLLIQLIGTTGLRAAEVAGLNVADASAGALSVRRTRTPAPTAPTGWTTTTTKGRQKRTVPILDPQVAADLAAYLSTHPRSTPDGLLFSARAGHGRRDLDPDAPLNTSEFLRRVLKPAAATAGVPNLRFHDLRHTAASLWASAGIDIFKVSRWLGHRNTGITEAVYAHLFPSDLGREAEAYAALLAEQRRAAAAAATAAATSNVILLTRNRREPA